MILHPYRRIAAMLVLALALALSFAAGIAVGITFATSRTVQLTPAQSGASHGRHSSTWQSAESPERVHGAGASEVAGSTPAVGLVGAPTLTGIASWHATGRSGMFAAAGPALRTGDWRGRAVEVCAISQSDIRSCAVLTLNDWCQCIVDGRERLLDLSDEAFAQLAPLSRGLVTVTVEWLP